MSKITVALLSLFAVPAMADIFLAPGQTAYVSTPQYVACQGGVQQPQPPPPAPKIPVTVNINSICLQGITPRDGKAIMQAAESCAYSQQQRDLRNFRNCVQISSRIDYALAESVIAKANTIIYEAQKERVREASATKVFMCEYGF